MTPRLNKILTFFSIIIFLVIIVEIGYLILANRQKSGVEQTAYVPNFIQEIINPQIVKTNQDSGPVINMSHIDNQLTKLPKFVTKEVMITTIHEGEIVDLKDKDIATKGAVIKGRILRIKNVAYWSFIFFDNSFRVMKVYAKKPAGLKPITFDNLKIGDNITIKNQFSLIGQCEYDECYRNIEIIKL